VSAGLCTPVRLGRPQVCSTACRGCGSS
jgi:hypothetical protein